MSLAAASKDLSFRDRAIQAAATSKLTSFAGALDPNPAHEAKIISTLSKTCPPLTRFATMCDTNVVKQLAFMQPNYRMATLSCPFPAVGRDNEEVFAGSLGDSMDFPCPVTIRIKDVRGDVVSVSESRALVTKYNFPTSTNNPLEEEGPPFPEGEDGTPPGPDRIMLVLDSADKEPCFVAIPKVFPVTSGVSLMIADPTLMVTQVKELPPQVFPPDSPQAIWYEAMRYGIRHLENWSIHKTDTLFHYGDKFDKTEFTADNRTLASRFTTVVTYLTPDDVLYHEVAKNVLAEKEKVTLAYGSKLLEAAGFQHTIADNTPPINATTTTTPLAAGIPDPANSNISALLDGLAKAISESSSKTLTGTEREKMSEAADAERFYSIMFASLRDAIDEDGKPTKTFVKAKIQPMFAPVLTANKNSKATKAIQEAVESLASELSLDNDKYAADSNLLPRMFDQPMTAALRTGQWEYQHTVLNPEGIKSNVGIHHLAPPRQHGATYKTRQEGETKLIQQEHVEEDKSRIGAKATELYHFGKMGTLHDINEMIGNFYALMQVIIEYNPEHPPLIWKEVTKFAMLF